MATTTNYGWTTPDDTSLVKDGAAAIRTLGSSVDTTTKALNPSTTLGDIEYRSSTANTNTRLGIGTSGQVLTVTGGVPVWAAAPTGGMTLISTTTLGSTSTTISSIPATYNNLQMIFVNATTGTANIAFQLQFNSDTGSNYVYTGGSGGNPGKTTYYGWDVGSAPVASNSAHTAVVDIYNYASTATQLGKVVTSRFSVAMNATPSYSTHQVNGAYLSASAISSITVKSFASGTLTGTVLLYGVK